MRWPLATERPVGAHPFPRGEGGFKFAHTWANLKTEEEWRAVACGEGLDNGTNRNTFARIPLPPLRGTFSPGEGMALPRRCAKQPFLKQ